MDFVLIHGHGHSGEGWQHVIDILERNGHRAFAPTLPNDPAWQAGDFAEFVAQQVDVTNPVIVGNSGAGNLMPALSARLAARHLVWLAAIVPDWAGGRTLVEAVNEFRAEIYQDEVLTEQGPFAGDDVASTYFLFHDCDLERLRFGLKTLRDFLPDGMINERPVKPELPPSTYILPRHDRIIRPEFMRKMARERLGVEPVEIDGGHSPQIGRAEAIADLITRV